ncbi:flagellar basal body-associated FliL family protein [Azospirillum griseum]|uniref:Flagellar protein FliL n=1 Tax=Azospirillum griseum TaxID=2496639 RepID=A0A3S0I512_9PROT|nr:flagellar basal body-associated FliL family protein [Azospirillum griseum]RTR24627.1 flagellar basal body-associated FliL family protein [Azospirillum griseum]
MVAHAQPHPLSRRPAAPSLAARPPAKPQPTSVHHPRQEPHTRRLVLTLLVVLLTLLGLAYGGSIAITKILEQQRVTAVMGPKARLAPLPAMDIALGGARAIDVQVSLVLAPKVKADAVLRYQDRIADRLFERIGAMEPERLTAPGSGQRLKDAVKEAVQREAGAGLIRDVYIERMVVR